ncbi:MAG: GNAT family N-acetyltransferase [Chloroflexota bacterium]|nr:GNAT family N-acetyltransferase [Chloroflexota bacterium]
MTTTPVAKKTLRAARAGDAPQISAMTRAMVADMASYGGHPVSTDDSNWERLTGIFRMQIEKANYRYVVVELADGNLAGFAGAEILTLHGAYAPKKILHVSAVYVLPEFRNAGMGESLLKDLLNWGREANCAEAELNVVEANPAATLYQKLGFTLFQQKLVHPLGRRGS